MLDFFVHTKTFVSIPQRSDSINDPRKNTVTFAPLILNSGM